MFESWQILVGLGVDGVLTSGQEASAVCGIQLIHLVMKAEGCIGILPAGKLCSDSILSLGLSSIAESCCGMLVRTNCNAKIVSFVGVGGCLEACHWWIFGSSAYNCI